MTLDNEVAEIVEGYRVAVLEKRVASRWRYPRAAPQATRRAAARVQRATRNLLAALGSAPLIVRERLLVLMRARVNAGLSGDWKPGDLFDDELNELAAVAGEIARGTAARERPGPRADALRLLFAVAIARALERHGVRVTGHQTGIYARTLRDAWHRASDNRLADDLRPLLRAALRAFREKSTR